MQQLLEAGLLLGLGSEPAVPAQQCDSLSGSSSSAAAVLAASMAGVTAWCLGLHEQLAGIMPPGASAVNFTLYQYLQQSSPEQRTVTSLLQTLREQCSWLFLKTPTSTTAEQQQLLFEQQPTSAPAAAAATGSAPAAAASAHVQGALASHACHQARSQAQQAGACKWAELHELQVGDPQQSKSQED
jgi:hypothetical protein